MVAQVVPESGHVQLQRHYWLGIRRGLQDLEGDVVDFRGVFADQEGVVCWGGFVSEGKELEMRV